MSSLNEELDTALMAAAGVLPSHFADSAELTLEPLSAIQATTLSLPGGAYGIECVVKDAGEVGTVILIVTGLVDHATGEILDRSEARTKWTEALSQALTALQEPLGAFKAGQIHMTDAFDALDKADECNVVGLFRGQTLAALLMTLPAKSTGQGAAAQLAAAIQAAEAEAADEEAGSDEDGPSEDTGAEATGQTAAPAAETESAAAAAGTAPGAAHRPVRCLAATQGSKGSTCLRRRVTHTARLMLLR